MDLRDKQLYLLVNNLDLYLILRRFQQPRGLRRRSSAARLLRLWVRIAPGTWIFVCCECCVQSGRGLCDGLITRPEESYRPWRVVVCDQETSYARRLQPRQTDVEYKPTMGCNARKTNKQTNKFNYSVTKPFSKPNVSWLIIQYRTSLATYTNTYSGKTKTEISLISSFVTFLTQLDRSSIF